MLQVISLWLHSNAGGKFLLTVLISMMPVAELRLGLPAGVAMGLSIPSALTAALLGTMLPVPFVILFIRRVFRWIRRHIPKLGHCVDRIEQKAYSKIESKDRVRYESWGLLLFVAVPLPGTGAWTGSLIAALLNLRLKKAVPVIYCGIVTAGIIMTALTYGVSSLL